MQGNKEMLLLNETRPRRCFLAQAVFTAAFTYLTGGVFLSGLAILMGAGDVLVSYLSVVVNICGVLILLFSAFLERFKSRKRVALVLTVLSRLTTLLIAVIPAFVPQGLRLGVFTAAVLTAFTLQAQTTVVLNQWMMGFVEEKRSGRYISLRQTLTLTVTVALSLTGGIWMDFVQGRYIGFVVLFGAAGVMSLCEIIVLVRTPDCAKFRPAGQRFRLRDIVMIPGKDKAFAGFVLYIVCFYLLLNISDSFTSVFMMKYLALPYRVVTAMSLVMSLPQLVLLGFWGKLCDRRGHDCVLRVSVWFFAAETLLLSFASPQSWYLFIPAAFLAASAGNAGFVTAVFNRRYQLMPSENRILYDNFYTAAIGLGFVLGPMTGGVLKGWLESFGLAAAGIRFAGIRLLYPVSSAGIVLLQLLYGFLHQKRSRRQERECCCATLCCEGSPSSNL